MLELFRAELGDDVKETRVSNRLTDAACCLVNPEGSMSAQLQKVLSMGDREFTAPKKIFEINPSAPLTTRLIALAGNSANDAFIRQCGRQLFANVLLLEGLPLDPSQLVSRVQNFMMEAADNRGT